MMNDQIKYISMMYPDRCQSNTTNKICTLILIRKDVNLSDLILQNLVRKDVIHVDFHNNGIRTVTVIKGVSRSRKSKDR